MFLSPAEPAHAFREITLDADSRGTSVPEKSRAARMPRFIAAKTDPAAAVGRLQVAVVGAGAVGRNVVLHLARLMVEWLWIIDQGHFKTESLLTQAILPEEIGEPKASNAGKLAKRISPGTRVYVFDGAVESLGITALAEADVVVLATDNLLAEVDVGQACTYLGKPLLHAAVHGDSLTAQVRFFLNGSAESPCPACGFNDAEWAHLNRQTKFRCDPAMSELSAATVQPAPTMSVSFLCSAAADLAMIQVLRFAVGLGASVDDTMVEYCGYTHRTCVVPLTRNQRCPADHARWDIEAAPRPLPECTLRALARFAGLHRVDEHVGFIVDAMSYVERGICRNGHRHTVNAFVTPGEPAGRCCQCEEPLRAQPFYTHRPVPARVLGPRLDKRIDQISDRAPQAVVVRHGNRAVLLRDRPAPVRNEMEA